MTIENLKIATDVQKLATGNIVELYELDATELGAVQVFYFTPNTSNGSEVIFNGITYTPLDFETEGFEISTTGQLPEPLLRLSNVNNAIGAAIVQFNDLINAVLTRRRTFSRYLDGQPGADPTAQYPAEIYVIDQKTTQNKVMIEFKLSAITDFTGVRIPRRQILRNSCTYTYRRWNSSTSSFDYSKVHQCPYVGANYFDTNGDAVVDPADDFCSKRLGSGCVKRFPGDATKIPFGGFPNVAKVRIR